MQQNVVVAESPVKRVPKRGQAIALEAPQTIKMPKLEPIRRETNFKPITKAIKTTVHLEPEPERETYFWPDFLTSKVEFLLKTFKRSFEDISRTEADQLLMKDFNASFTFGQIFRSILKNAEQFKSFSRLQR